MHKESVLKKTGGTSTYPNQDNMCYDSNWKHLLHFLYPLHGCTTEPTFASDYYVLMCVGEIPRFISFNQPLQFVYSFPQSHCYYTIVLGRFVVVGISRRPRRRTKNAHLAQER